MTVEDILKVEIDNENRILIFPESSKFPMIYREANGIQWDSDKNALISAIPREWSHVKWFDHILDFISNNTEVKLKSSNATKWVNVPTELKIQILNSGN